MGFRTSNGRTTGWDGKPLTKEDAKFYELREVEGYNGWIDEKGEKAACPMCNKHSCTRQGFAGKCS